MRVIPIPAHAGITGFESPAAEYSQLRLSLDDLLIEHPSASFIGLAQGESMQDVGIFDININQILRKICLIGKFINLKYFEFKRKKVKNLIT